MLRIITCTLGSFFFALSMNAPKRCIPAILSGTFISSALSIILYYNYGNFTACLFATLAVSLYGEILARKMKTPTTVFLLPSVIPMLPGSYIYYSMLGAVNGDERAFTHNLKETAFCSLGIALGTVICSIIIEFIRMIKKK